MIEISFTSFDERARMEGRSIRIDLDDGRSYTGTYRSRLGNFVALELSYKEGRIWLPLRHVATVWAIEASDTDPPRRRRIGAMRRDVHFNRFSIRNANDARTARLGRPAGGRNGL